MLLEGKIFRSFNGDLGVGVYSVGAYKIIWRTLDTSSAPKPCPTPTDLAAPTPVLELGSTEIGKTATVAVSILVLNLTCSYDIRSSHQSQTPLYILSMTALSRSFGHGFARGTGAGAQLRPKPNSQAFPSICFSRSRRLFSNGVVQGTVVTNQQQERSNCSYLST